MKHNLPLSLCTLLGWCNLTCAQDVTQCDSIMLDMLDNDNPDNLLNRELNSKPRLPQSVFTNPYIIEDGESFFLPANTKDSEFQSLKNQYFSLCLPLPHIHVTSRFGLRRHPVFKEYRNHLGVDLRARYQPAYAMMAGTVERIGNGENAGKLVVCTHGKYTVHYYHLSQIRVREGQRIKAGDIIGITGDSGRSTGPHLHLGVQLCGEYIDPMILLLKIQRTKISLLRRIMEHYRQSAI